MKEIKSEIDSIIEPTLFSKKLTLNHPYLVSIKFSKINENEVERICNKYCRKFNIRNRTLGEKEGDYCVEVGIVKKNQSRFIQELKELKGVEKVMMFSHTDRCICNFPPIPFFLCTSNISFRIFSGISL